MSTSNGRKKIVQPVVLALAGERHRGIRRRLKALKKVANALSSGAGKDMAVLAQKLAWASSRPAKRSRSRSCPPVIPSPAPGHPLTVIRPHYGHPEGPSIGPMIVQSKMRVHRCSGSDPYRRPHHVCRFIELLPCEIQTDQNRYDGWSHA